MSSISDYEDHIEDALIKAASSPDLRRFMEPNDIETKIIDYGDGVQARVEALNAASVRNIIERIINEARRRGVDLKDWICGKEQFDLCEKLNNRIGDVMRMLDDFLKHKLAQGGREVAALIATFNTSLALLEPTLVLFGAIGFCNNVFINLCDCEINENVLEQERRLF